MTSFILGTKSNLVRDTDNVGFREHQQKFSENAKLWGWRDVSGIKSTGRSSGGPVLKSQLPKSRSQPSTTPVP